MTRHQKKIGLSITPWILDEILEKVPNRRAFIEEAIVKLWHNKYVDEYTAEMNRLTKGTSQKLKNESEEKPLNHAPMPYWSGAPLCLVPSDFGVLT